MTNVATIGRTAQTDEAIDQLEVGMVENFPTVDCPVTHRFTPGLYIREIFMPAGSLVTSKIHNTEHPFVVSEGAVNVWTEGEGAVTIEAPYTGITKPGTRRVLYVLEDCIWLTFHPTLVKPEGESMEQIQAAVDKVEEQIIDNRENKRLTDYFKVILNQIKQSN